MHAQELELDEGPLEQVPDRIAAEEHQRTGDCQSVLNMARESHCHVQNQPQSLLVENNSIYLPFAKNGPSTYMYGFENERPSAEKTWMFTAELLLVLCWGIIE